MGAKPRISTPTLPASLKALAKHLKGKLLNGDDTHFTSVVSDSRHVIEGDLFACLVGMQSDGHTHASSALEKGAKALLVQTPLELDAPQILVSDTTQALGECAALFENHPARKMTLLGLTGTNGKTTTSYILESIINAANKRPGVLGTVNYRYAGIVEEAPYTTPTPVLLQKTLSKMQAKDTTHVAMEVSSAALSMGRLHGLKFDVAGFSNLSQDHLDVHGSMESYCDAKALLFKAHLSKDGIAVINCDDEFSEQMVSGRFKNQVIRVSSQKAKNVDVFLDSCTLSVDGIEAKVQTPKGSLSFACKSLLGDFNLDNILLAVGMAQAAGFSKKAIKDGIESLTGVPGRVERVANDKHLNVFVDYAHTPDALAQLLKTLRPITEGRLMVVFGAGGDRDKSKRKLMGEAATQHADLIYVTSDNPRTEDPHLIIKDVLTGVPNPHHVSHMREHSIQEAVFNLTPKDVLAIAGKGHEDYQILGTTKIDFDDRKIAAQAMASKQAFSLGDITKTVDGKKRGKNNEQIGRLIIDGRQGGPGDMYVAIVGEKHDGHAFCKQAYDQGVRHFLTSKKVSFLEDNKDCSFVRVSDTRLAMGAVAKAHRKTWQGKLIGVTGSAGKTTTVGLMHSMLSVNHAVHKTRGSMNNETGVPLTLMGLADHHEFAIIEMGMRGLGQIAELADVSAPDIGVITNAGAAHLGLFDSKDDIAKGKSELYHSLAGDGIAIYPANDKRLKEPAERLEHTFSFGVEEDADVRIVGTKSEHEKQIIQLDIQDKKFDLPFYLMGHHNALNAAASLAVGLALGVDINACIHGLSMARPAALRGEVRSIHGRTCYMDCYNANPQAMESALRTVSELSQSRSPTAVLGDMLELGSHSKSEHLKVGKLAGKLGFVVIALGEYASDIVRGVNQQNGMGIEASSHSDVARKLLNNTQQGDWVLFKASRGLKLERAAEALVSMPL